MASLVFTAVALATVWLTLRALRFARNTRRARKSGLPYTFSLVTELEVWAYLTDPFFRKIFRQHLLQHQQGWPRWARFMIKDWMYEDKYRAHDEFGDVFLVVSPGGIICYIADPNTALDLCLRRRDFVKPREKMKMIEPFGSNVVSSEGELWRLHYRITAPPFADAVNELVWTETKRQAAPLRTAWASHGVNTLKSDVYTIGVNVMASAGFGRPREWIAEQTPVDGHELSLLNSIYGVVTFLPLILLLPKILLKFFCKAAYVAYSEFEQYMREFIAEEKSQLSKQTGHGNKPISGCNLLRTMLATNAREQGVQTDDKQARMHLTENEVLGNIFMFFMAGYDTTANTIIFSCVAMALFEDTQNRVLDELDAVLHDSQACGRNELSYIEDFPRLRELLAYLYETLRVFPVVLPIGRQASGRQLLKLDTAMASVPVLDVGLPDKCGVIANITGVHYNPRWWPEPEVFQPMRWLSRHPNAFVPSQSKPCDLDSDVRIPSHRRGTFLTFSEGPRACLGRRFAQAEYVAFFAEILQHHKLKLAPGVDRAEVEKLFRSCSAGSPITLAPPADIRLQLVPR
ncbi:cytochrome P450 [Teratosphaeria nubilosa]|uniref:Cytochrome P450 n=1 Tax=Teratosphaeria nubilosa TaxID=161662 RepID=A0A6G1KU32_9PEZI|nr:cytochrome P450 [Teratosphaeria nubilosa]